MHSLRFLVVIVVLLPWYALAEAPRAIGSAFSPQTGELLYRELHYGQAGLPIDKVTYVDPAGNTVAIKQLDFSRGDLSPVFTLQDLRRDLVLGARFSGDAMQLSRQEGQKTPQLSELFDSENIVIDAGFDGFVRQRWDQLGENRRLDFDYAFPSRLKTVKLSIREVDCDSTLREWTCFEIEPSNWLVSVLLPAIVLAYDSGTRRLRNYRGLSNISDNTGKSQQVDIFYQYPDEADAQLLTSTP
ncbi:MAG: hypothetical protein V7711_08950 [Pseudomonadales bacterium]